MSVRPDGTVSDCTWKLSEGASDQDMPEGFLDTVCKGFPFAPFADGTTKPRTLRIVTTVEEIESE